MKGFDFVKYLKPVNSTSKKRLLKPNEKPEIPKPEISENAPFSYHFQVATGGLSFLTDNALTGVGTY